MTKAQTKLTQEGHLQESLSKTVEELLPLYETKNVDSPRSLVSSYPNTEKIVEALRIFIDVLFPGRMSHGVIEPDELDVFLTRRLSNAWRHLRPQLELAIPFRWIGECARMDGNTQKEDVKQASFEVMGQFLDRLPFVREMLIDDVQAAYDGDPAALTFAEVKLAYPGLLAIVSHRLAHELYKLDVPIIPRVMSEWIHSQTGVDINPGATIGRAFFIDHATGVVIGETTKIGNNVKLYQGVTLGARSFPLDDNGNPIKHIKRHPTVEDNVIIYANATILGGDTVIGKGSTIGGNVFLMESVPPKHFVTSSHEAEPKIMPKKGKS